MLGRYRAGAVQPSFGGASSCVFRFSRMPVRSILERIPRRASPLCTRRWHDIDRMIIDSRPQSVAVLICFLPQGVFCLPFFRLPTCFVFFCPIFISPLLFLPWCLFPPRPAFLMEMISPRGFISLFDVVILGSPALPSFRKKKFGSHLGVCIHFYWVILSSTLIDTFFIYLSRKPTRTPSIHLFYRVFPRFRHFFNFF